MPFSPKPDVNVVRMEKIFLLLLLLTYVQFSGGRELEGSFNGDVLGTVEDVTSRLDYTLYKLRGAINPTVTSIQNDIAKLNRDRIIIAMANCLAGIFGILAASGPQSDLQTLTTGQKVQALSSFLYGYGYSRPWQDAYENPILDCGINDLEMALEEYRFLEDIPTLDIHKSILEYYIAELNHVMKRRLYCITQRRSTNQEAKNFIALIDIFTELQQEQIDTKER